MLEPLLPTATLPSPTCPLGPSRKDHPKRHTKDANDPRTRYTGLRLADLAYHFVIDRNGHIYQGRPYTAVGDTRTSYDPTGHLLIAVKGNFEEQDLTEAQLESLVAMLAWGVGEFRVLPTEITGHRDWAATACPGERLYALIESGELAAAVAQAVGDGPATLEISCGEDATQLVAAIEAGSA